MIPLPSIKEIRSLFPLSPFHERSLGSSRLQAKAILSGADHRKVIIVGPCSVHDKKSTLEYASRLKELAQEVSESLFLVMRVYVEKPRTALGWKGLLYDPHLDGSGDVQTGLIWTRELFTQLIEMGMPIATEFVDPITAFYFQDLVTWGFIGARTSASQPHRQLASMLQFPIGFKNDLQGALQEALNGALSARHSHHLIGVSDEGHLSAMQSRGNPWSHIVLRGADTHSNYDECSVCDAIASLQQMRLPPRLMIDCAHGNSNKDPKLQPVAYHAVLEQIAEGKEEIIGMMLESHLEEGSQVLSEDPSQLKYATSITDSCMSWATTEELIRCASSCSV